VIPVGDVYARSPQNEHQDCEDSPRSEQKESLEVPTVSSANSENFSSSKAALFTIEYLMKMPSAVPSRREKSALKL
jgi:hypothetical protein